MLACCPLWYKSTLLWGISHPIPSPCWLIAGITLSLSLSSLWQSLAGNSLKFIGRNTVPHLIITRYQILESYSPCVVYQYTSQFLVISCLLACIMNVFFPLPDIQCPVLPNPANGIILFSNGNCVGSIASYICDADFMPRPGDFITRECLRNGEWMGSGAQCISRGIK